MCSICFEKFNLSEDLHSTDCGHVYHLHCMQEWRSRSTYCPQCRRNSPLTHRIYLQLNDIEGIGTTEITILKNELKECQEEILELKMDLKESEVKKTDIEETLKDILAEKNKLKRQLEICHFDMLKMEEDLSKFDEEKNELEDILRTTLTNNMELESKLKALEMRLNVNNSKIESKTKITEQHLQHNNNENPKNKNENEIQNIINHDQLQQRATFELSKISTQSELSNNLSIWFIKQTSQGGYQVKGPFNTVSSGIIEAQKDTMQETSLIIKGVNKISQGKSWFSYIENLSKNVNNKTLANKDVFKITYKDNKKELFVQFHTAEWRNDFINYYNENPSESGIRFSTKIPYHLLSSYDTLFKYVKTLKVFGYKNFYRTQNSTVLVKSGKSVALVVKNKKDVDDFIKAKLNIL